MNLSICTYNVRGLGNKTKREQIFSWLKESNHTICLLQETHSGDGTHDIWKSDWGYDAFFSGHSKNNKGIGILLNSNISYTIRQHTNIVDGRLQALDISINDKEITLVNIFGPYNDDIELFNRLEHYMKENQEKSFIIGGDFNTVLNENIDKRNGRISTHVSCRNKIKHIAETCDLIDIWRDMHPHLRQYTWHSSHKPPIFCRLDYFLISQNLKHCVESTKHSISYKSDHTPVILNINNIKH